MIPSSAITDADRVNFMWKLANNVRLPNGLIVSPWESNFIRSFTSNSRPSQFFFSDPRRVSADKMRMKYGSEREIAMPFPPAESSAKVPEADAGCCMFLVREDGRQQPCNAPAELMRQNGFRYCREHGEAVQRDLKRSGKTIHLLEYKPAKEIPATFTRLKV
jgi:hypothetical protein